MSSVLEHEDDEVDDGVADDDEEAHDQDQVETITSRGHDTAPTNKRKRGKAATKGRRARYEAQQERLLQERLDIKDK